MEEYTNSTIDGKEANVVYFKNDLTPITKVKYRYVDPNNPIEVPVHQTSYSAGADVRSAEDVVLNAMETKAIGTNLIVDLPKGFFLEVRSRSGLALKNSVFVLNSPGTIDEDYKNEVKIILHNAGLKPFEIKKGDRIAQFLLRNYIQMEFVEENFDTSEKNRGGGFGSTGIK